MMIADVIREAQTEQEVFHLLNAYIEAGGGGGKASYLLVEDVAKPPSCVSDVTKRCLELMGGLDVASRRLDHKACLALKEGLHVFSNALIRLQLLEREKPGPLTGYVQVHGMRGGDVNRVDVR